MLSADPHLLIATGILGAMLLGSIVMMVDMGLHPHCKECYHCQRREADRKAAQRHVNYHYWTGRRSWDCKDPKCPGR